MKYLFDVLYAFEYTICSYEITLCEYICRIEILIISTLNCDNAVKGRVRNYFHQMCVYSLSLSCRSCRFLATYTRYRMITVIAISTNTSCIILITTSDQLNKSCRCQATTLNAIDKLHTIEVIRVVARKHCITSFVWFIPYRHLQKIDFLCPLKEN